MRLKSNIIILKILVITVVFVFYSLLFANIIKKNLNYSISDPVYVETDKTSYSTIEEKIPFDLISIKKQTETSDPKPNCNSSTSNEKPKINFLSRYPFLLDCKTNYSIWSPHKKTDKNTPIYYDLPATEDRQENLTITRGIVVYFPIESINHFKLELKWLYRSWINVIRGEPIKWRTDLIIFIDYDKSIFNDSNFFLNQLNCSLDNRRKTDSENSKCILIDYKPIKNRKIREPVNRTIDYNYEYFLNKLDIFSKNENELIPFYNFLIDNLKTYANLDSILVAFDGYEYFSSAKYDYLLRSDMDVFLTPLFRYFFRILLFFYFI
jgi:hypothetical protein